MNKRELKYNIQAFAVKLELYTDKKINLRVNSRSTASKFNAVSGVKSFLI